MALSIISNQAASIAARQLGQANDAATSTAEKLSSGKRVNSAADDAAASAIAARLSAEIAGLQTASVNAGQASSLLQIADGAFQNVEDILTRAKSLAVQAGSEQISDTERSFLDQEFQALKGEIDRIAEDTEFNGTKLVNAEIEEGGAFTANVQGINAMGVTFSGSTVGGTATGSATVKATVTAATANLDAAGVMGTGSLQATVKSITTAGGGSATFMGTLTGVMFQVNSAGDMVVLSGAQALTLNTTGGTGTGTFMINVQGTDVSLNTATTTTIAQMSAIGASALTLMGQENTDLTFKVGTGTNPTEDEIDVQIGGITTGALGIEFADITTKDNADSASIAVSSAIDNLQSKRSEVGAAQNRLDFATENVNLARENQEAARSELEDLNVARAITQFSQQQLLVQAGTSTLSQANNLPQNLLQLFN